MVHHGGHEELSRNRETDGDGRAHMSHQIPGKAQDHQSAEAAEAGVDRETLQFWRPVEINETEEEACDSVQKIAGKADAQNAQERIEHPLKLLWDDTRIPARTARAM